LHYYKALADGDRPVLLAGHSIGEYDALLAAGAFDFLTGLRLVQARAELMGRMREGGMGAVIGMDSRRVQAVLASVTFGRLTTPVVANVTGQWNTPQVEP